MKQKRKIATYTLPPKLIEELNRQVPAGARSHWLQGIIEDALGARADRGPIEDLVDRVARIIRENSTFLTAAE